MLVCGKSEALTSGPAVIPVQDLYRFLLGGWHIRRRVADRRRRAEARLAGMAWFAPAPGGLAYRERGVLVGREFRAPASQTYQLEIHGSRAEVRFQDGRFFHELDLCHGRVYVRHACAPDVYSGRFSSRGPNVWMAGWQIEGPHKQMLIVTRYSRAVAF